jgi:hypothetical protein
MDKSNDRLRQITLIFTVLLAAAVAYAAQHGTSAEARAMLLRAIAHYNAVGRKQALADFTAGKPPFRDRDLYVFCLGPQHTVVANGAFPNVIGTQEDSLIDIDGKGVGARARQQVSDGRIGLVRYRWVNPATRNIETKITYFAKAGDDLCGVGAYEVR